MLISKGFTKKACVIPLLSGIILLIIIRLLLPYGLLRYVEYRLNKIPDYTATIGSLDMQLYKGSYVIKDLDLKKINKNIPVPFFSAKRFTLAIEWQPLLQGHLVGQLDIQDPKINFVIDPTGQDEQTSINAEWQNAVKALFPLNFNRIILHNGQAHLRNFKGKFTYDIYLKNINAQLDNLRGVNAEQSPLASTLLVNANTMDGAPIHLQLKFNPFSQQPMFDLDAELTRMQLSAINNFLKYYTKVDIKYGLFSVYIEAAAKNGKITGYIKPLLENIKINEPSTKTTSTKALYKMPLALLIKILENPQKKTVATKINISGNINNADISIWSTLFNLLKNAFLQALLPGVDNTIELKDVNLNNNQDIII